jgi:hypothetical protein
MAENGDQEQHIKEPILGCVEVRCEDQQIPYVKSCFSCSLIHMLTFHTDINFRDSKHDKLYEMLTHMFARKIKNSVIEMIQSKFKTFGSYFNDQIITLIEQAKSSTSQYPQDRPTPPTIIVNYV